MWGNGGVIKYNYETKIGHEPQILISASLMTHCYKRRDGLFLLSGSEPKYQHAS